MYKVIFISQSKVYEIYAKKVCQSDLPGFLEVSEFVFGSGDTILLDPAEEKVKSEFSGVSTSFIPVHQLIRIDKVESKGKSKIRKSDGSNVVANFPGIHHNMDV